VSANFMSILGLHPLIGRDLTEAENLSGSSNVALISENLWRTTFGGATSVIGTRAVIDGVQRAIVGVLPRELQFGRNPDVLLPIGEIVNEPGMQNRDNHPGFWALGRLKPGVTLDQAHSDFNAIAL